MDSVRLTPHVLLATPAFLVAISSGAVALGEENDQPPNLEVSGIAPGGDTPNSPAEEECTPVFAVTPAALDFGNIEIGTVATLTLTLSNEAEKSNCILTISEMDFQFGSPPFDFAMDLPS